MNDEQQFWAKIWKYVTTAFCVFVTCIFTSCQIDTFAISKAITDGANPIAARCAIMGTASGDGNALLCQQSLSK